MGAQCERAEHRAQQAEAAAATASKAREREEQASDREAAAAKSDERTRAAAAWQLRQEAAALTQQLQAVQQMELGLRDRLDAAEARVLVERQTASRLSAELHATNESHARALSHKVPCHTCPVCTPCVYTTPRARTTSQHAEQLLSLRAVKPRLMMTLV